jgi:hypothetical protein
MTTRPLSTSLACAFACLALSACSSSSGSAPAQTGDDGGSSSTLAPPPSGQGIQLKMATTIAGSAEDERCQFVQVTQDLWVHQEDIRYTPGSHHFILWHTPYASIPTMNMGGTTVDTTQVFQCLGGPSADWQIDQFVGGAQSADAPAILGDLPSDVALHVPAGSVLIMDLHVLNASAKPLDTTVLMNLDTIPQSQVKQEAGIYFFYNPFIRVPANAKSSARMSCPVTSDVTLTTAQTHMHKQGLGGVANLEDSTGNVIKQLYTSSVWTDPPVTEWAAPGMALKAGQQIDYQCNYDNPGNTDVMQGLSAAKNEMCVFAGAYYPRDTKFETCSTTGKWNDGDNAGTYIGTGTATCTATLQCLQSAKPMSQDQGDSLYGCVVDSCPKAAKQMTAALDCFGANGASGQTACMSQLAACEAASCN